VRTSHSAPLNPPLPPPAQLESLQKELRKKQKGLTENASGNAFQRARFLELKRLLQGKLAAQQAAWGAGGGPGGGGGGREGKLAEEGYVSMGANVLEVGQRQRL
jgi:hypothetical protein